MTIQEEMLKGGDHYIVSFKLFHPEYVKEYLYVGSSFTIREGRRVVAEGIIESINL